MTDRRVREGSSPERIQFGEVGERNAALPDSNDRAGAAALNTPTAHATWQAVRRAALRSSLRLAEGSGRGRSSDELAEHLLVLADIIWRRAFGVAVPHTTSVAPLPVGVLLETLRKDILEELAGSGEKIGAQIVVALMQSVDAVAEQLDDDPAHRFIARFLGAAGLEALVEVAHDMRSPLASIVLLVETLRLGQSGPVNEVQERQLALVYGATFGLSLMANDVIDLARGDERVRESGATAFSIADVLQSVAEIVQPIAEEKQLELTVEPPESDWRLGYPTPLHRVLLNLTTNALKFTDSGFVRVECSQLSRTAVEFTVRDTGRGIPAYLMSTLFDAFRQHHMDGKTTFSAAGLGLSICRKFVASMGGVLSAENWERGSLFRFTIELPLAKRL